MRRHHHDERGGQTMEFADFYADAKDDCLRAVVAATGDRQLAEDLVAEAFAKAWASWRSVQRHPAPRAWVVRTALNIRISWWRRRRREVPWTGADVPGDAEGEPGGVLLGDRRIAVALRGLPPRQREVVLLRVYADLDIESTARALKITPGTVATHFARAK